MEAERAVAVVGVGAILPDAPDVPTFWANLSGGRYCISDVTDRWDAGLYYDPDPKAPDKTYSKIGGWVREYEWNPMAWRMPIPPKVGDMMDPAQKWAVAASRQALMDYGYPERPLDPERVAVIVGNALGGDFHLLSAARILFPEVGDELRKAPSFQALPAEVRQAVMEELVAGVRGRIPDITEDTMPGELGNIVAGRVAALYDFKGPNYITDAACASAMAGMSAAVEGLIQGDYDAVLTGGIDANMSASTFVKFCKIGALSATGSRPYAEGADGFVMGEGAGVLLLKRLADAERDGDKVYAVIMGVGGSSDGKGKGITAPNPSGQRFAVVRAWEKAGVAPAPGDMMEGHGTSTKVGDVVEVETLHAAFTGQGLPAGSIALGSVKSNIGHLKGGAGAVGVLKAVLALHHKAIPPSVNFQAPNPAIDFTTSPFRVNTELRAWEKRGSNGDAVRRAGVSAFGFGGTNFHMVLEEYVPGRHRPRRAQVSGADMMPAPELAGGGGTGLSGVLSSTGPAGAVKAPLRGALVVGGGTEAEVAARLREVAARAGAGDAPEPTPPPKRELAAEVRVTIDYGDAAELADLAGKAVTALESGEDGRWRALRNKGVFLGRGRPGKVAFLFTGQGSQYVGMLEELRSREPIVAATFDEADAVMTPLLGGPLTERIFVDGNDAEAVRRAEEGLSQTAITQPAVLAVDMALARLYAAYGITPDLVMGHSLGEYGALVAADAMDFGDALTAVAARGDAMTRLAMDDKGLMAAVFGPLEDVTAVVDSVDGYVVVANVNSTKECVIGGATDAVGRAMEELHAHGYRVAQLPVSHAFHTRIVAPAADVLRQVLSSMRLRAPRIPVVANVDASFYPTGPDAAAGIVDILGRQIGSPVQFVKGLEALYDAGTRVFVEMGPKRALYGMAEDVVAGREGVTTIFTNHPRTGDIVSVNRALCAFYSLGLGTAVEETATMAPEERREEIPPAAAQPPSAGPAVQTPAAPTAPLSPSPVAAVAGAPTASGASAAPEDRYVTLGRMFADFLDRSFQTWTGGEARETEPVRIGITGAALGLPGGKKVFDEDNVASILRGDQYISSVPEELRGAMLDRHITRLVKGSNGEARFETIGDPEEVIKLAGRAGTLDLADEFGFPEDRVAALDWVSRLAIAAGIDALRDAGIPLVRRYKTTSTGSKLPVGWALPEEMRDDTGIVFGSAFPGYDQFARAMKGYYEDRARRDGLEELKRLRERMTDDSARAEVEASIEAVEKELHDSPYSFDRRFLFQVLSMGHAQFAEYIGARGPNTATNAACSTGTQAIAVAHDWIRTGRCRRVIVVTADDITTDDMFPWFASGFLASGSAATDARVEDAALPFDRRRHGLIIGMGGAALVVEDLAVAAERGVWPICEVLGTVVANSAYHGSRLDVEHIAEVMERLVTDVERRWGISRYAMAPQTVFVSHETYTPARGGSASAEVRALRRVFGAHSDDVVVANTKGYTGHPMGVAIEDTLAVKMLETGIVPPVANHQELDPELGTLNLSRGGSYPVHYALRLAAGFGSQISMSLLGWTPPPDGARRAPGDLGFRHRIADMGVWTGWLRRATGYDAPELEIVRHTLRVKDQGPPAVEPTASREAAPAVVAPVPLMRARTVAPVAPTPAAPVPVPAAPAPSLPGVTTPVAASTPPLGEAPPETAPTPGAPEQGAEDDVARQVLQIVAEQTGYPPDMLALDLDLEADLGIDTVKQAEMFAAIRAAYDIERDDNLALRDYPTLGRAIEFVYEKRPDLKPSEGAAAVAGAAPVGATDPVAEQVLQIVAEQTGYPPDMLALDLDLEADLGIDTVKQAEMFAAIRAAYDIERDDNLALRDYPTLGRAIEFVYEKRPDLKPSEGAAAVAQDAHTATPSEGAVQATAKPEPEAPVAPPSSATPVAAASTAVAGAAPVGATDPVVARVLGIVAEQTGYPPDMLELDLDLEADLGIDTVKQAEMFAAIRAAYDIERDDNLALRDYPTLGRAVEFVYEKRPDLKPSEGAAAVAQDARAATPSEGAVQATAKPEPEAPVAPPSSAAPVAAASTAVAGAAPVGATDPVVARVLGIVAEQTGYPPDMLELDLDLEADLGIDTVKQAEMFAAIRAAYDIERDDDLALRDYPTLGRAIEFVYEKRPDLKPSEGAAQAAAMPESEAPVPPASPAEAPASAAGPAGTGTRPLRGSLEAAQAVPRREPVAVVRPAATRFPRTGVELAEGSRVIIVPDERGVGAALAERLGRRGVEVLVADPSAPSEVLVAEVEGWRGSGPVTGLYWLPALDATLPAELVEPADRKEALRRRVKALHALARALYGDLAAQGAFMVAGTRLGGRHGYDPEGALDPAGGAVTGFTKSLRRERPEALVKAVDFEPSRKTAALADLLIEETLSDPGVVEVGYGAGHRWTVGLGERPVEAGAPLPADSVYLVTGAAGSIVSAILTDLAGTGGTFWLLDLAPEPDRSDPDLERIVSDREGLRTDLIQRLQADGGRVTPAMVERELVRIERAQAALAAILALEEGGATVHYRSLDLRDPAAVTAVVGEVLAGDGRVDVLLHAAGLEISRALPDKSPEEFALVFDVKVEGWFNLVAALGDAPLGRVMAFSSIAGRFGNLGQTDYAAANDVLCKAISEMRRSRPDTRALAVDWTAWGEIGMAARGSMPAIMKAAGIDMLAPEAGMGVVRRELTAGSRGEVVIAGGLGVMVAEDPDAARLGPSEAAASLATAGPMVGKVLGWSLFDGLVVETELDPRAQPFLDHHRIDGVAVLPGVMGLEAMAEAAGVGFPELHVTALEDVGFHAPFKFYRDESRAVTVRVTYDADGEDVLARCRVEGARILAGRDEPEVTTHFTGTVRLSPAAPDVMRARAVPDPDGEVVGASSIYRTYFHGPAYQVLERAWWSEGLVAGRFAEHLPPNHEPAERVTVTTPRLVELAFQTAGLAEMALSERMGLPSGFRRLELLRPANGEVGSNALASPCAEGSEGAFDVDVTDGAGRVVLTLREYRTSALPGRVSLAALRDSGG